MSRTRGRSRTTSPALKSLARFFRVLADESRLTILSMLHERGEMTVGTLGRELGQSQPAVSHHLSQLRNVRLIAFRRDGKFNHYHLDPRGIQTAVEELNGDGKLLLAGLEVSVRRK